MKELIVKILIYIANLRTGIKDIIRHPWKLLLFALILPFVMAAIYIQQSLPEDAGIRRMVLLIIILGLWIITVLVTVAVPLRLGKAEKNIIDYKVGCCFTSEVISKHMKPELMEYGRYKEETENLYYVFISDIPKAQWLENSDRIEQELDIRLIGAKVVREERWYLTMIGLHEIVLIAMKGAEPKERGELYDDDEAIRE